MPPVRARDIGIPFSGNAGPLNAITDVPGVQVGFTTLWRGEGPLKVGEGPVRTGVTAILPRGPGDHRPCFGGSFAMNAAGEMTGLTWLEERGLFEGPVLITNTHSVGVVRDAAIQWMRRRGWVFDWTTPIVGETYDGHFNDINGGHVQARHVDAALDGARGGAVAEGNVGGGTGMMTYEFKGGTGTASRLVAADAGGWSVGVLVQSNYGRRRHLRIAGLKMGEQLGDDMPARPQVAGASDKDGSIIVIVATDAPLLPHQLRRLAKRPALGIGRLGGVAAATSGDIFLAFSTAGEGLDEASGAPGQARAVPNLGLTPLFEAVIDATEEAILNALVAGESASGIDGLHIPRLPHERIRDILRRHNLLVEP